MNNQFEMNNLSLYHIIIKYPIISLILLLFKTIHKTILNLGYSHKATIMHTLQTYSRLHDKINHFS